MDSFPIAVVHFYPWEDDNLSMELAHFSIKGIPSVGHLVTFKGSCYNWLPSTVYVLLYYRNEQRSKFEYSYESHNKIYYK